MVNDRITVRGIAFGLLAIAAMVVIGGIWLASVDKQLPDALIAIGSGALGGASAFLVSTRSSPDNDNTGA